MGGRRIELVANVASGAVGAGAPDEASRILAEMGVDAKVRAAGPGEIMDVLRAAVDAGPDLLMVLAGDGTVRAAAELCGPDGPVIAPLPGGTMNMLPFAIYGQTTWAEALEAILTDGVEKQISGGTVEKHSFYVAAILGSPALWARAREAARHGKFWLAIQREAGSI